MNVVTKQFVSQFVPVSILLITIYSVLHYLRPEVMMLSFLDNTTVWWMLSILILIFFFLSKKHFFDKINQRNLLIVWIYLLWNMICIVRGMFVAEIYWDWKGLISNTMGLMLPVVAYSATNK